MLYTKVKVSPIEKAAADKKATQPDGNPHSKQEEYGAYVAAQDSGAVENLGEEGKVHCEVDLTEDANTGEEEGNEDVVVVGERKRSSEEKQNLIERAKRAPHYKFKDIQLLRVSASDVAAVVGLKRDSRGRNLTPAPEMFMKYLYQDLEGLLMHDAKLLSMKVVSEEQAIEALVAKAGTAEAANLRAHAKEAEDGQAIKTTKHAQRLCEKVSADCPHARLCFVGGSYSSRTCVRVVVDMHMHGWSCQ